MGSGGDGGGMDDAGRAAAHWPPARPSGGALPKLALPFRLFAGGRVGSGKQYWSWIHREDWMRMVRWAIDTSDIKAR